MRYYELSLLNGQGQLLQLTSAGFAPSTNGQPTFSSRVRQQNGQYINNPGALNVEFDIPVVGLALPQGNAWIRVSGIGLRAIGQGANLNADPASGRPPCKFILSAGLMRGLPLANDYVNRGLGGVIAQGQIFSAYAQWQSTEQSLYLSLIPANLAPVDTNGDPIGISIIWAPGQPLSDALNNSFAVAFPLLKPSITIQPDLRQAQSSQNVVGWYENISQFASYILGLTKPLGAALTGNKAYPGVIIGIRANSIFATDATQGPKSIPLAFQDLIGQPTWISPNTINLKCVLRADLQIGDVVTMPPDPGTGGTSIISSLALTQQGAAVPGAPSRNSSVFKGGFIINDEIHHFGNFRQADGDSWATAFSAVIAGAP